jgi:chemotaxis protein histidine kinase CheA
MIEPKVVPAEENSKYLALFLQSSEDIIRELNDKALSIETSLYSRETLDEVYRLVHTLKGNASFLGLSSLKTLLHDVEGLITAVKISPESRNSAFIDFLWQGITLVTAHVELIKTHGLQYTLPDAQESFLRGVNDYLHSGGQTAAAASQSPLR